MKAAIKENVAEALIGLAVVLLAVWFVSMAWTRTGGGRAANAVEVNALFPNASGVNIGTDVRVAGLKVGSVIGQSLDPATWQVKLVFALDPSIKLPSDSSAAITSEGLLGSTFVGITPGGSETALKSGDTIVDTQGAMDLMGLIGGFINKTPSSSPPSSEGADAGSASAPAP
ncbi:outer membrane lipid asymmetry maintenance protein MlaD [Sphingomonas jatrophae]|uniref:Phospholipid/cholesterol/gamma-HCH transport system substrate-binding protein n=1 Tax=Sphingomonas jatrophae TaxID=1166337 RepID=A0A1I6K9G6_9SPHN|nr:outer membrane lipid asymmetry maintenance protein MlaD [Sphingomonas jatrophae]SFR87859.1 phospholipid/cholesterol/gamma-HCH transport system substrate-binding protein [Sphingomonas jatrophae]